MVDSETIIVQGIRADNYNQNGFNTLSLYGNSYKETYFQPGDFRGSLLEQQTVVGIKVTDDIVYIEQPEIKGEKGIFLGIENKNLVSLGKDQLNLLRNTPGLLSRFDDTNFGNDKKR